MSFFNAYEEEPETENTGSLLETDVMRFLSIISIVLMVIFALVQSIPFDSEQEEKKPKAVVTNPPEIATVMEKETPIKTVLESKQDRVKDSEVLKKKTADIQKHSKAEPKEKKIKQVLAKAKPVEEKIIKPEKKKTISKNNSKKAFRGKIVQFESDDSFLNLARTAKSRLYVRLDRHGIILWYMITAKGSLLKLESTREPEVNVIKQMLPVEGSTVPKACMELVNSSRIIKSKRFNKTFLVWLNEESKGKLDSLLNAHKNGVFTLMGNGAVTYSEYDK